MTLMVLATREIRREISDPGRLLFDLAWPLMALAVLGFGVDAFARPQAELSYLAFLGPGVLGLLFLRRCAAAAQLLSHDARFGFREYLVAPVARSWIVLGWLAGSWLVHAALALVFLIVYSIIVKPAPAGLAVAGVAVLVSMAASLSIGLVLAVVIGDIRRHARAAWVAALGLAAVSGVFFPIQELPEALQWIALVSPLTYMVDGIRAPLIGVTQFTPFTGLAVTAILAIVCTTVGIWKSRVLFRV